MFYRKSFLFLFLVLFVLVFSSKLSLPKAEEKHGIEALTASALSPCSGNLSGTVLTSITVTPAHPHKAEGMAQQFRALGRYSDHTVQDLTTQVTWTSSDTTVAWIDSAAGLAVAVSEGISTITATSGSIKGFATLRVVSTAVPRISVFPANGANGNINQGYSQQFTAVHITHAGKIRDLTNEVIWKSSNPEIATISPTGLATSLATGTTLITATLEKLSGGTLLTVNPPFDACQATSGCTDTDGDGLCDEWEIQGYIDVNGNGVYDDGIDTLLPDAYPNRPDIYLHYDYMGWGEPGASCVQDSDCTNGGATPNLVCHENRCNHNHKPDPAALQIVVDSFARHGVALHIDPGAHEVPHSEVITWSRPGDGTTGATAACAGADIQAGVLGGPAVSFHDIKDRYFDPKQSPAYHYVVFSHFATCLDDDPLATIGNCSKCPNDRSTPPGRPTSGISGTSELPGNDFIVSLGARYFEANIKRQTLDEAGVFMHELGHDLGLHHNGDNANHELAPNYLSVMNNKYIFSGIQEAEAVGSTVQKTCTSDADCQQGNVCFLFPDISTGSCRRVDYSSSKLNTITENALDEAAGVSPLSSGLRDIVRFFTFNGANGRGPAAGPIDWDGLPSVACSTASDCVGGGSLTGKCLASGACEVQADLNKLSGIRETFVGYNDWDHGSCSTSADCPVNGIRLTIHETTDPSVDPHEPCVRNKCQSLWYPFQCTQWGKED